MYKIQPRTPKSMNLCFLFISFADEVEVLAIILGLSFIVWCLSFLSL